MRHWFFHLILLISFPAHLQGEDFHVQTTAELESALAMAENNGADDVIHLADGIYTLTSTLRYDSQEDNSIAIQGTGTNTVLDGGQINQRVLFVRTYRSNSDIVLSKMTIRNGYSQEGDNGGGLFVNIASGKLTLEGLQILNCAAPAFYFTNHGGGAYVIAGLGADVIIRNNIIAGNRAKGLGGGLYLGMTQGTLSFINNTIVDNHNSTSIPEGGGGVYLRLYFNTVVASLYNNILWGNTYAYSDGDIYIENDGDANSEPATVVMRNNTIKQLDYNLDLAMERINTITGDPLLTEVYELDASSPCLDQGDDNAPGSTAVDGRGNPRAVDGDLNGNAASDHGAIEYLPPIAKGDVNCDLTVNLEDAIISLQILTNVPTGFTCTYGDVNGDSRLGLAEAIYTMREIAGYHN